MATFQSEGVNLVQGSSFSSNRQVPQVNADQMGLQGVLTGFLDNKVNSAIEASDEADLLDAQTAIAAAVNSTGEPGDAIADKGISDVLAAVKSDGSSRRRQEAFENAAYEQGLSKLQLDLQRAVIKDDGAMTEHQLARELDTMLTEASEGMTPIMRERMRQDIQDTYGRVAVQHAGMHKAYTEESTALAKGQTLLSRLNSGIPAAEQQGVLGQWQEGLSGMPPRQANKLLAQMQSHLYLSGHGELAEQMQEMNQEREFSLGERQQIASSRQAWQRELDALAHAEHVGNISTSLREGDLTQYYNASPAEQQEVILYHEQENQRMAVEQTSSADEAFAEQQRLDIELYNKVGTIPKQQGDQLSNAILGVGTADVHGDTPAAARYQQAMELIHEQRDAGLSDDALASGMSDKAMGKYNEWARLLGTTGDPQAVSLSMLRAEAEASSSTSTPIHADQAAIDDSFETHMTPAWYARMWRPNNISGADPHTTQLYKNAYSDEVKRVMRGNRSLSESEAGALAAATLARTAMEVNGRPVFIPSGAMDQLSELSGGYTGSALQEQFARGVDATTQGVFPGSDITFIESVPDGSYVVSVQTRNGTASSYTMSREQVATSLNKGKTLAEEFQADKLFGVITIPESRRFSHNPNASVNLTSKEAQAETRAKSMQSISQLAGGR